MKLKKGDRVWVRIPTNATIASVNKRYGYTLMVDDGIIRCVEEFIKSLNNQSVCVKIGGYFIRSKIINQYFDDNDVQYIASPKIKESRPTVRRKPPVQQLKVAINGAHPFAI